MAPFPFDPFPFEIVGFDLDGTLLDTHEDLAAAVNHALALIGRTPVPASEVRKLVGGGAKLMLERALTVTGGIPEAGFDALYRELLAFYEHNIAVHTAPYPGTLAMLDGLAAREVKLAVVTNKLESFAVNLFEQLALADRFFTIIGGDTLGIERRKPKPDMVEEMVRRGGGGKAAFVGDTSFDTGAARAAGLPCVAVSFGFNDLPMDQLGASVVIDHFDALIPALEAL
jgi:phosphoglycolate phosphatase